MTMLKPSLAAALAAATLMSGAALAADPAKPEAPKEKKICKYEGDTTTRISRKRVCKTQEEWDSATRDSLDAATGSLSTAGRAH